MEYLFVLAVGLVAGTLSGIVGFGSSVMLMPVLVIAFGPIQAVPIMAIAAILANLSRVMVWWREVDWRTCAAYSVSAVPFAALGARTLLVVPAQAVEIALGAFFILMIGVRRWMAAHRLRLRLWQLTALGVPIGFLTGIVASTGPITAPIFLAAGLVKGAFLSSEASASLAVYFAKALVFRNFGVLPLEIALKGLIVGSTLMAGAFIAKRFVLRMEPGHFNVLMDALMLISGTALLLAAAF
ncbi:MAG: sulfite exporter TauE/SafE family protein [Betaproteobacteria bacterium]|nr:sulfite exporter TauE/SafE family protein [Betaproteobacteria bacterium]